MTSYARVERLWPGETVVVLGTGPSLTRADVDFCRGKSRVIAVNNAFELAPWADAMYAADAKFWRWVKGAPDFAGMKFTVEPQKETWPGLQVLRNAGREGLANDPSALCTGYNSGYQAIGLATHLGASRVILLGFDMQGTHYFGSHPDGTVPPFTLCLYAFSTLVEPIKAAGVDVVNCSRVSALESFRRGRLTEELMTVAA